VHCVEVSQPPDRPGDRYRVVVAAVDAFEPGDVMVVSTCRGCYRGMPVSETFLTYGVI
jgi:hypothetical protein